MGSRSHGALALPAGIHPTPRVRLDRYEVLGEIARGGMGTVLLGRLAGEGGFSRLFAIKTLHPHLAADEEFVHMLLDEARLASRIHHSNVVPVMDVCRSAHGLFVVMEFVEGFPFTKILGSTALSAEDRIRIGVQVLLGVLSGLDAAHNLVDDDGVALGLVHRDVSPQNVLVGLDGVGRIADFGIAHAAARITTTQPGTVKGKVAYMAPENARGERIDRRADVFCVGVMLWECLAGQRLFKADNEAATMLKLLESPILPPCGPRRGAVAELDAVCLEALDRDVSRRYASAHDMAAQLSRAAGAAGYLVPAVVLVDLLRLRFGDEIARTQAAIRECCAPLTVATSAAPTLVDSDNLSRLTRELPTGSLPLDITVDSSFGRVVDLRPPPPARARPYFHPVIIAVGSMLCVLAGGALLWPRGAKVAPAIAATPAAVARPAAPVAPAASPAAAPVAVVRPRASRAAPAAASAPSPRGSIECARSSSRKCGQKGKSPGGREPFLEKNPYPKR